MAKPSDFLGRKSFNIGLGVPIAGILSLSFIVWHHYSFVRSDHHHQSPDHAHGAKSASAEEPFEVSSHDFLFEIHEGTQLTLKIKRPLGHRAEVKIVLDDPDIIETSGKFSIPALDTNPIYVPVHSKDVAGHCIMSFQSDSKELGGLYKVRIKIKVVHHIMFGYLAIALGWCYLTCWCITYYPQIYRNYARKSVVGFSFDYLALNLTGHLCYCIFNNAFYYNSMIQKDYTKLHPKGEMPVKIHDVLFSYHAVTMNTIYLLQILCYERGDQRLSPTMLTFVGGLWVSMVAGVFGAITERVSWLNYLYYLSYIKVGTTPIKYTPQIYMHCVRKSTEGWSIFSVLLDFCGSMLCLLQIFTDAVNNDDWDGTVGNPGKVGLGIIGATCGGVFMLQHFILYPPSGRKRKVTETSSAYGATDLKHQLERLKASFRPPVKTGVTYAL